MPDEKSNKEVRLTLSQHLEELRRRLLVGVAFLVIAFFVCLIFQRYLMKVIIQPHKWACGMANTQKAHEKFISLTYTGPFVAYIKLALITALFFSIPFIGYQLWKFVSAGLYPAERKGVISFALPSFFLFITGCMFGYFILIPYALYFLQIYPDRADIAPVFSITGYLDLVLLLTIIVGLIFEVPLVMLFLAKTGLVSPKTFSKGRKIALLLSVILAAFITPPDIFSQIILALPMILLYEVGIILCKIFVKAKETA
jgi:Tat protein translocase TatC